MDVPIGPSIVGVGADLYIERILFKYAVEKNICSIKLTNTLMALQWTLVIVSA